MFFASQVLESKTRVTIPDNSGYFLSNVQIISYSIKKPNSGFLHRLAPALFHGLENPILSSVLGDLWLMEDRKYQDGMILLEMFMLPWSLIHELLQFKH